MGILARQQSAHFRQLERLWPADTFVSTFNEANSSFHRWGCKKWTWIQEAGNRIAFGCSLDYWTISEPIKSKNDKLELREGKYVKDTKQRVMSQMNLYRRRSFLAKSLTRFTFWALPNRAEECGANWDITRLIPTLQLILVLETCISFGTIFGNHPHYPTQWVVPTLQLSHWEITKPTLETQHLMSLYFGFNCCELVT